MASIQSLEFYNQYLDLKEKIASATQKLTIMKDKNFIFQSTEKEIAEQEKLLQDLIKDFKFVLNQLTIVHGIKLEDLILLSLGVDIDLFK